MVTGRLRIYAEFFGPYDSGCSPETGTEYQFTVEEVVLMGRMPYLRRFQSESSADYEIVNRSLAITGCTELRRRKITELSGGESSVS